ncbi:MAG: hypothetical protein K0V04_44105 [Deltaproteobacteria bacterium]|nr:hypothetical protein [Deltaproteobacteria bacterium]
MTTVLGEARRWGGVLWLGVAAMGCATAVRTTSVDAPPDVVARDAAAPASSGFGPHTVEPTAFLDDVDEEIDRDLRRHAWMAEHAEGDERLRAWQGLGESYARRAHRVGYARDVLLDQAFAAAEVQRLSLETLAKRLQAEQVQWWRRAAAAYDHVLDSVGPSTLDLRPRARWGLAEVLVNQGKADEHRTILRALVRDDPDSGLAAHAIVTLGDIAFGEQRFGDARRLYMAGMDHDDDAQRGYATYKLGWVEFLEGHQDRALGRWTQVVRGSREHPTRHALADEAANDCVMAYVSVGRPELAQAFFERLHPRLAAQLLERLAQAYVGAGDPESAQLVRSGLKRRPSL